MYADYSYYQETFGGTMPEAAYAAAERKAEACISYLTYLNGDIFATEDDRVKQAVCTAADVIQEDSQKRASGSAGLKSESNDGYSVSYVTEQQDGQTVEEALRRKVFEAIRVYLLPTGWLSRRVKGGCCHDCECAGDCL